MYGAPNERMCSPPPHVMKVRREGGYGMKTIQNKWKDTRVRSPQKKSAKMGEFGRGSWDPLQISKEGSVGA